MAVKDFNKDETDATTVISNPSVGERGTKYSYVWGWILLIKHSNKRNGRPLYWMEREGT